MLAAACVGRVGGLAVALGVGAAVATGGLGGTAGSQTERGFHTRHRSVRLRQRKPWLLGLPAQRHAAGIG